MNEVVLYPGNWLYNAGVVGFLRVLAGVGKNVEDHLTLSGEVRLPDPCSVLSSKVDVGGIPISLVTFHFFRENWETLLSKEKRGDVDLNLDRAEFIGRI